MPMRLSQRSCALLLIACLAAPVAAQSLPATEAQQRSEDALQPKFFWGIVLDLAFKFAMQALGSWLSNKLSTEMDESTMQRLLLASTNAAIVTLSDASLFGAKAVGAAENTALGESTKPLRVENGRENFQGAHVALLAFDSAGKPIGLRPVAQGFKTGERFKLKVLPTFDALLVLDNINPQLVRKQIYPAKQAAAVALKAGVEVLVPLGPNEFFELTGATGEEQLVITLRDARAFGDAASKATVNRKDDKTGSSFVQEVAAGTYPVMAQSLRLNHAP